MQAKSTIKGIHPGYKSQQCLYKRMDLSKNILPKKDRITPQIRALMVTDLRVIENICAIGACAQSVLIF